MMITTTIIIIIFLLRHNKKQHVCSDLLKLMKQFPNFCVIQLLLSLLAQTANNKRYLLCVVAILTINNNRRTQCTILYVPFHNNERPLTSKLTEVWGASKMSQRWGHDTLQSGPDCPHSSVLLLKPRNVLHYVFDSKLNVAPLH